MLTTLAHNASLQQDEKLKAVIISTKEKITSRSKMRISDSVMDEQEYKIKSIKDQRKKSNGKNVSKNHINFRAGGSTVMIYCSILFLCRQ